MVRCQSLNDAVTTLEGIFGTARDDDAEASGNDVQSLAHVFANFDLVLALVLSRDLRFDHDLDALQMCGEALARTRIPLCLGRGIAVLVDERLDGGDAGLDLFKDKRLLLVAIRPELLGLPAVALAQELLQDRRQPSDALIRTRLRDLQILEFRLGRRRFRGHGKHQRLQAFSIIGKGQMSVCHAVKLAEFAANINESQGDIGGIQPFNLHSMVV